jgi:CheY-like chemotaxis protein
MTVEILNMPATLLKDRPPHEIADTDAYNRLQMRRAIQSRGDPTADPVGLGAEEMLRVLVVDNHRDFADTTSKLIGLWGHEVRRAYDGTTGLAIATAFEPNVLLIDIVMSGVSGLELIQQIRQRAHLDNCFIVAVTGRTDEELRLHCTKAGVDLYLIKPVSPSILKALLLWESGYALCARQGNAIQPELAETFQLSADTDSNLPNQLSCQAV